MAGGMSCVRSHTEQRHTDPSLPGMQESVLHHYNGGFRGGGSPVAEAAAPHVCAQAARGGRRGLAYSRGCWHHGRHGHLQHLLC